MKAPPGILLLADRPVTRMLTGRLGAAVAGCDDPYDALRQMRRRSWPAVVLTAPRPDFPGLCRAARRLQTNSQLFALCSPSAEPQACSLTPGVLDDYFIYPPTSSEIALMLRAGDRQAHLPPGRRGGLTATEVTEMLIAARSIRSLEAYLAAKVAARIGAAARWVDADKLPAGAAAMLRSQGESPRVLTAEPARERIGPDAQAFIAGLQGALPALVENALWAQSLRRLAVTDHLTGAHNRRYFYYLTGQVLLRARQENLRVALLLYDIDDFKRYNDTYGYAAGDDILRETACLVRKVTRSHDVVARIGGDEFAVLFWDPGKPRLPDSRPVDTAYVLADRFRRAVVEHRFPSLGPDARGALTVSGGLASFPADGTTCRELLRKADEALKQAKRAGKNAIRLIGKE